jgi:hypothetical protein
MKLVPGLTAFSSYRRRPVSRAALGPGLRRDDKEATRFNV